MSQQTKSNEEKTNQVFIGDKTGFKITDKKQKVAVKFTLKTLHIVGHRGEDKERHIICNHSYSGIGSAYFELELDVKCNMRLSEENKKSLENWMKNNMKVELI